MPIHTVTMTMLMEALITDLLSDIGLTEGFNVMSWNVIICSNSTIHCIHSHNNKHFNWI